MRERKNSTNLIQKKLGNERLERENPINREKKLRRKEFTERSGNGDKKKLGQFDFRQKEKTKKWEMEKIQKYEKKRKCLADLILAEKNLQ